MVCPCHLQSLLYTADGKTNSFRISVDHSKLLYRKCDIKSINITIPADLMENQVNCSLEDLPQVIEIQSVPISDDDDYNSLDAECHFDTCEGLVEEINTLVDNIY